MSVEVVFAIAGVIALFVSVWGGGIRAKEIEIPQSSPKARLFVGSVGFILISISFWLTIHPTTSGAQQVSPTSTSTPLTPTPTAVIFTETVIPSPTLTSVPTLTEATLTSVPGPNTIFQETFDNNKLGWDVGEYNDANFISNREINDGKFYRYVQMKSMPSDGTYWGSMQIPSVFEKNFCLIFDAKKVDGTSKDAGIVVVARATNYGSDSTEPSYYFIYLFEDGTGLVYLEPKNGNTRQLGTINNSIAWGDNLTHTLAISLQDNILEIKDWQTKTAVYELPIASDDLLSDRGNIRIGTELSHPGDNITIEFDNVLVLNWCPQ